MNERLSPNRELLVQVANLLRPLLSEVVFVGGQVAELLVTDPLATGIRATDDVDVIVSAYSRLEYKAVEDRLIGLGLRHDTSEDAPICRWRTPEGHKVDVMSQNESILGFSNRWYALALEKAVPYDLEPDLQVRIPPAPVFLATKCEAWVNRGEGDFLRSHDMEDIITLVAGRPELPKEVLAEGNDLRLWISEQVTSFLAEDDFYYALQGALPDTSQVPELLAEVRAQFAEMLVDGTI